MHSKNNMLFIFVCIILMCSYVQFVYNIQCAVTCILACRTLALVFIEYSIQTAGLPPSLHGQHSYFEKQVVNSLHSDRSSFQLSVVHGAPGTSVQFISYFEMSWPIGEGERGVPLSQPKLLRNMGI